MNGLLHAVVALPRALPRRRPTPDVRALLRELLQAAAGRPPGSRQTAAPPTDAALRSLAPREQLAALVDLHAESVYRVALSVVRDHALAEDVAQEALLKAWQALPTYRGEAPLRNWLLRITHNTAVSVLRRRREELRDPVTIPEGASTTDVERSVHDSLASDDFASALARLDDLSRAVVVLREVEGLSYDEIAEALQIPIPTVKTRLLRARRLLATHLEEWRP